MTVNRRQIGGENSRRGNRYEDFFAVFKLIELAPGYIEAGTNARLHAQAGCHVDDLVVIQPTHDSFYQLKSGENITWGLAGGKLEKEFLAQRDECENSKRPYTLVVVVSEEARQKSLIDSMPENLKDVTAIFLFPILQRISALAHEHDLFGDTFDRIRASRFLRESEHESIVQAFHLAWMDHVADADGFCVLEVVIDMIAKLGIGRFKHEWKNRPTKWREAEEILTRITDLQFWVDRGYFEWKYNETDNGLFNVPCESDGFNRFIDRLLEDQPKSFAEFERLLP